MICDHHRLVLAFCFAAPHIDAEIARRMQDDITGQCRDCLRLSGDALTALQHVRKTRGMTAEDVAHRHLYVVQEGRAWRSTEPIPWCAACRAPLQDRVDVVEVQRP